MLHILNNDTIHHILVLLHDSETQPRSDTGNAFGNLRIVEPDLAFASSSRASTACKRLRGLVLERLDAWRAQHERAVAFARGGWITTCVRAANFDQLFRYLAHHGALCEN
jgi:hypothetical protein